MTQHNLKTYITSVNKDYCDAVAHSIEKRFYVDCVTEPLEDSENTMRILTTTRVVDRLILRMRSYGEGVAHGMMLERTVTKWLENKPS